MDADLSDVLEVYEIYKLYKKYMYKKSKRKARIWVYSSNKNRDEWGAYARLMPELRADESKFQDYCRMPQELFDHLLNVIRDDITTEDTNFRQAIQPELKLMLTLRYLATGESFQSLHYHFRVGNTTARRVVYDVCTAIWNRFSLVELQPATRETFIKTAQKFLDLWQFPNCVGCIDGKHIKIRSPNLSGTSSIVLQAVADADGLFQYIDVGDFGQHCNAEVFKHSSFGRALTYNSLPLPEDAPVLGSEPLPFVFLGDEAYPLQKHLMKPYSRRDLDVTKRIYNYRHSQARRVIECAFDMLTAKWGLLQTTLTVKPEHARLITLACCVLHNYVRRRERRDYSNDFEFREGETLKPSSQQPNFGRPTQEALNIRGRFASLFQDTITLPLPWQAKSAHE